MGRPMRPRRARRMPDATRPMRSASRTRSTTDLVVQPTEHQLERPARPGQHVAEHRRADRGALGRDAGRGRSAPSTSPVSCSRPDHDRDTRQRVEQRQRVAGRHRHRLEHQDGIDRRRRRAPASEPPAGRQSSTEATSTTASDLERVAKPAATRSREVQPVDSGSRPAPCAPTGPSTGWRTTMRGSGLMRGSGAGRSVLVVDLVRGDELAVRGGDRRDDPLERLAPARVDLVLAHARDDRRRCPGSTRRSTRRGCRAGSRSSCGSRTPRWPR